MLPFCSSFQEMLDSQTFMFNLPVFKCCVDQILPAVSYPQPGESPLVALTYILLFEADPSPKRQTGCVPPISAEEAEAEHGKLPLSQLEAKPGVGARALTPFQPPQCWILCRDSAPLGVFHPGGWVSNNPQPLPPVQQTHSPSPKAAMGEARGAAPEPGLQLPLPSLQTKHILGMQMTELLL